MSKFDVWVAATEMQGRRLRIKDAKNLGIEEIEKDINNVNKDVNIDNCNVEAEPAKVRD